MMNRTMIVSSLLLIGAGCAHRSYTGADYSGNAYSSSEPVYESPTSKGAGAQALRNDSNYTSDSTVVYTVVTPDPAASTQQGAGARALIGQADYIEIVQPDVVVSSDVTRSTDQGAGARTLTGERTETFAAGASDSSSSTISGSSSLSRDDANFLREAMQSGAAEVRIGELVQQKAQNPSLKSFGEMLVTDHNKANDELRRIVDQKQLTVPMATSSKDQAMIDRLSSLDGNEFDRVSERDLVEAHQKAVKLFKHAAEDSKDSDIKAFAQKTLPTLEEHLRQAKQLKSGESKSST